MFSLFLSIYWTVLFISLFFGFEPHVVIIGSAFIVCALSELSRFIDKLAK